MGRDHHRTLSPAIFGFVDAIDERGFTGWAFRATREGCRLPLAPLLQVRAVAAWGASARDEDCTVSQRPRPDVADYYGAPALASCGLRVDLPSLLPPLPPNERQERVVELQHRTSGGGWETFLRVDMGTALEERAAPTPPPSLTLLVIDDFYADPDAVRAFALQQAFVGSAGHKGRRTTRDHRTPQLRARFDQLLSGCGLRVSNWEYPWNGCFQVCTREDPLVVHCDVQSYAAIVFLTPDAPCGAGTSLYRHAPTQLRRYEHGRGVFDKGHLDLSDFEEVDRVGNVYNRLVVFNARHIHAASAYFGIDPTDARLFQIFFFDAEDNGRQP